MFLCSVLSLIGARENINLGAAVTTGADSIGAVETFTSVLFNALGHEV